MEGAFLTEVLERHTRPQSSASPTPASTLYLHRTSISKALETHARRHSQELDSQTHQQLRRVEKEQIRTQTEREGRRYRKVMREITCEMPEKYYDGMPLRPGLAFFKAFLPSEGRSEVKVQVRLPRSILIFEDVYEVEPQGLDSLITDRFKMSHFYKQLQKQDQPAEPVAVRRTPDTFTDAKCALLSSPELFEALFKAQLPTVGMFQELLPIASGKPAITRLFYVTSTRVSKASRSYQITSSSEGILANPISKHIVCTDSLSHFEVFKQSGLALKRSTANGAHLVAFLESRLRIKFEEIVLDWVEIGEECWLLGCKGFKLDLQMLSARELRLQAETADPEATARLRKATIEERLAPMHCKLCLLPVQTSEMEHVLPFKLLLLYKHHIARRGKSVLDLSHLRVNTVDYLSHWVRICDICHMLVLAEYDLFETEMRIGGLLNVPVRPPEIMGNPAYKYPNFLPGNLLQWRFLLQLQWIEWEIAGWEQLYMHFSLFGQVYTFKSTLKPDPFQPSNLNCARLFTYFSTRDKASTDYMRSLPLHIRLTRLPKWSHPVLAGFCRPFSVFSSLVAQGSDIVSVVMLPLYKDHEIVGRLRVSIGHSCDQQVQIRNLQTNIERLGPLYIPETTFMPGEKLPLSWLEALGGYQEAGKTTILDEYEELERQYQPLLSERQLHSAATSSTKVLHLGVDLDPLRTPICRVRECPATARAQSVRCLSLPRAYSRPTSKDLPSRRASNYSTAASSRVLYSTDRHTHLKTPTFLPSRLATAPQSPVDSSISQEDEGESSTSMQVLEGLIPGGIGERWEPDLEDAVEGYLKQRQLEAKRLVTPSTKRIKRRTRPKVTLPASQRQLIRAYSQA